MVRQFKIDFHLFLVEMLAVGSYSPYNKKSELLNTIRNSWSNIDDYPFDQGLTFILILSLILQVYPF